MSQYTVTDDGRRLSDAHEAARVAGGVSRWLAVRLSDGGTDGQVYDERPDAVKYGGDHCFYVQVQPGPMPPADGSGLLELHRRAKAAGFDFTDPAQTPMRPTSGPLPDTIAARMSMRGFQLPPHYQQIRRRRRG